MPPKQHLICLLLLSIPISYDCNHPILPILEKDPRSYKWTIDTITYPGSFQTSMEDIWGSSPENVYICGHNDRGYGKMFHYDGKNWKPVELYPSIPGVITLCAVKGTDPNNIIAVGGRSFNNPNPPPNSSIFLDSSLIIRFDGSQWKEEKAIVKRGRLRDIWIGDKNNIWCCGDDGLVYHYNGITWIDETIPIVIPPGGGFIFRSIYGRSPEEVFMVGKMYNIGKEIHYYYGRKRGKWNFIDSSIVEAYNIDVRWGEMELWVSSSGTFYSVGSDVFSGDGSSWRKMYEHRSSLHCISGTEDNNFFIGGTYGSFLHFNGKDWYPYREFEFDNIIFLGIWADKNEIFALAILLKQGIKTIVVHGK